MMHPQRRLFFFPALFLLSLAATPMAAQCAFDVNVEIDPVVDGNVYCPGDTAKLSTGNFDSYQWYYNFSNSNTNGTLIDGATENVYSVDISEWGFAYFYVVATDEGCSEASAPVLIDSWTFLSPVVASDGESEFCNGDSTEISVPFGGYVNFQWYRDGEPIAGATESNYWVKESGTYVIFASPTVCPNVVLNSGVGPTFTFLGPPVPVISQQGQTLTTTSGPNYQWLRNNQIIPGATSAAYTPTQNGSYTVRVMDGSGCAVFSEPFLFTITHLDETSPLARVSVYPTPAREKLWVDPGSLTVEEVRIFDANGKLCFSKAAPAAGVFPISIDQLDAGLYWCALQTGSGVVYRQLVKM